MSCGSSPIKILSNLGGFWNFFLGFLWIRAAVRGKPVSFLKVSSSYLETHSLLGPPPKTPARACTTHDASSWPACPLLGLPSFGSECEAHHPAAAVASFQDPCVAIPVVPLARCFLPTPPVDHRPVSLRGVFRHRRQLLISDLLSRRGSLFAGFCFIPWRGCNW